MTTRKSRFHLRQAGNVPGYLSIRNFLGNLRPGLAGIVITACVYRSRNSVNRVLPPNDGRDRIRAAYYTPKSFRSESFSGQSSDGRVRSRRLWPAGAALVICGFAAGYFWSHRPFSLSGLDTAKFVLPAKVPEHIPPTGVLVIAQISSPDSRAPVKVRGSADGTHCLFEMSQWGSDQLALRMFVRAGEVVEASLPLGQYRGKTTCGTHWYGSGAFGVNSTVDRFITPFTLGRNAAGLLQGVDIDLTRRPDGNLHSLRL